MLLKGLALTPPVIGRITIGKVVERNGKRLPEKDDEFTLTSQVQQREGWVAHPVDQVLRKAAPGAKLRTIPIRLLFDDPDLNMRASYCLFDRITGRPICTGDGQSCRRSTPDGMQVLPCPTPEACEPSKGQCKPFGRLNVRVDTSPLGGVHTEPQSNHQGDEDTLGSFIFRTTGFNSIRTLATRLRYFHAVANGRLSAMPLELRLRGKSTAQSHRAPIYYVDMAPRTGYALTEAVNWAMTEWDRRLATGFNQVALDEAARTGFAQGAFEESADEVQSVVEEFFPVDQPEVPTADVNRTPGPSKLADKLADKLGEKGRGHEAKGTP